MGDVLDKGAGDAARDAANAQAHSAELGIAEQRRQFDAVQALLAPFIGAGRDALPGFADGASMGGFADRIGKIMGSDVFEQLVGKRREAVGNQMAQAGLNRSGAALREAAAIPTDVAMAIENQLYGRESNLVNMGQASSVGQANAGMGLGNNVASLLTQSGNAQAQGIIGAQQGMAAGVQNLAQMAMTTAFLFSDPALKENMEPIGTIGDLTLYEWDWKSEVSDVIGKMSIGFSADEVATKYPHHVVEIGGFKAIDYPSLTEELRAKYVH